MVETDSSQQRLGYDNAWQDSLLRPAVIAALVGCILVALVSFIRHLGPGLPAAYINILRITSIGAALVGCYTTTVLVRPGHRQRRTATFRLAELGLILFVARFALWSTVEGWPTPAAMILQPFGVFLTSGSSSTRYDLIAWECRAGDNDFLGMGFAGGASWLIFGGSVQTYQWRRPPYSE